MMRHRITFFLLALMFLSAGSSAQEADAGNDSVEVTFTIVIPKEISLDTEQRMEIKSKLEAALAKLQCAGAAAKTPFVLIPEINVTGTNVTSGTKEAFVLIEGDLILVAKNRYDGTAYNELTLPLQKIVTGKSVNNPKSELIKEINPKDRRLIRFIRNTRQRIVGKYSGGYVEVP